MLDLFELRDLLRELYIDNLRHYLSLFSSYRNFEEFVEEMARTNEAIIKLDDNTTLPAGYDLDVLKDSDFLIINKDIFIILKEYTDNLLSSGYPNDLSFYNYFTFLTAIQSFSQNLNLKKEELMVLYPWTNLNILYSEYTYLRNYLEHGSTYLFEEFYNKTSSKNLSSYNLNILHDFKIAFKNHLNQTVGNDPLPEQEEYIENFLKYKSISGIGGPGTSKTFTGAAALLLNSVNDYVVNKMDKFTYISSSNTYKAQIELLKKLFAFLKDKNIQDFLKKYQIPTVKLIFASSKSRFDELKKEIEDSLNFTFDYEDKYYSVKDFGLFKIEILSITREYSIITERGINFVFAISTLFYDYKFFTFKKRLTLDDINSITRRSIPIIFEVNGLHIEEASQFPVAKLGIILTNLENYLQKVKENGIWRFSFSGDPRQLSPIYSYLEKDINAIRIGDNYNLFTFYEPTDMPETILRQSLRVPKPIVSLVEPLYEEDLTSEKEISSDLNINSSTSELTETIKKALSKGFLRIEYKIINETTDPYELPLKSNEIESFIIDKVKSVFPEDANIFYTTPFKLQENIVIHQSNDNRLRGGTVDKVQGDESEVVIFSTVVANKVYMEKVRDFVFVPSRINVAITRTKNFFVLIHSDIVYKDALLSIDSSAKEVYEDFKYSILKKHKATSQFSKIKKSFVGFDINLGMYMFQNIVLKSQEKLITLYLPLKIGKDRSLKIGSPSFQNTTPKDLYVEIKFYTFGGNID